MGLPGTIPIAIVASGTGGSSSTTTFTFGAVGSGSLNLLPSGNYQLQIVSATGVTLGFYAVTSWSPMVRQPGAYDVGTPPTFGAATTCTLATSPGTTGTSITWNLVQNAVFTQQGLMSYPSDANGYPLNQAGGMTMTGGSVTLGTAGTPSQLSAASVPCKMVVISPSVASGASSGVTVTVGSSSAGVTAGQGLYILTTYSGSAVQTQPPPVTLQVSDLSQVWVKSTLANDVIGFVYFV
jgi:hypothetical protein